MYSYLRGTYKGAAGEGGGAVIVEAAGIGYEVVVPTSVEMEIVQSVEVDDTVTLHVSAQSGRDAPWPVLFGFLRPEDRAFWELLKSVPRVGGKSAARAMAAPTWQIAQAIYDGNKAFLDGLPGITLEGAEKIVASLRKKVTPFLKAPERATAGTGPMKRGAAYPDQEMRQDAVDLLAVMGVKRVDAMRSVEAMLAEGREDIVTVQDIISEYFRTHGSASVRSRE